MGYKYQNLHNMHGANDGSKDLTAQERKNGLEVQTYSHAAVNIIFSII